MPLVLAKLRAALNSRLPVRTASDYSRLAIGTCVFRVLTLLPATNLAEAEAAESRNLPTLVVAEYIPHKMALKLRQQGQYYADAMGNAWLETGPAGVALLFSGNRARRLAMRRGASFEPHGLRLLLYLLTDSTLLRLAEADLVKHLRLSPETVASVLLDLAEQDFLQEVGDIRCLLRQPALALAWMEAYGTRLRPQLLTSRYRWRGSLTSKPSWPAVARITGSLLGSTVAARHLVSCTLAAEPITLYTHSVTCHSLLHKVGLVPDPNGPVELLQLFAAPTLLPKEYCVHPLVICADLLRSSSDESRRVSRLLLARYLPHLAV